MRDVRRLLVTQATLPRVWPFGHGRERWRVLPSPADAPFLHIPRACTEVPWPSAALRMAPVTGRGAVSSAVHFEGCAAGVGWDPPETHVFLNLRV